MTYKIMFFLFKMGIVSEKKWKLFCDQILLALLEENKDVLIRLKNC